MQRHGEMIHGFWLVIISLLFIVTCEDQTMMPVSQPEIVDRRLQMAFLGETGVFIKINGQKLTDPALAARLRVQLQIDSGRPTFAGNNNNKTVQLGPIPIQADSVRECDPQQFCEINVIYHDLFGGLPADLEPNEGSVADGDYTVKLYRDINFLVGSKAIAVNHPNTGGSNGTFLDEASDQIVTFYLNENLQQIQSPTVDKPHTRASTHLTAGISRPAVADTTIQVGQTLSVKGVGSNGLSSKRYAWDWNASGGSSEIFDTEFSSSDVASHSWSTAGDYKIRVIVRDGNDDGSIPPRGGHYAVSAVKTVHVVNQILDSATAQGNLLPFSMSAGSVASVGFVMRNAGTTTWSNAANYSFDLHRDGVWLPLADTLDHSVPPGTNHSFTFNMLAPNQSGTFACFYRMKHGGFFGQENGRSILVTSGFSSFSATGAEEPVTTDLSFDPVAKWLGGAPSGESGELVLPGLQEEGVAALEYTYHHFIPRDIDVVFRFRFDPAVMSPAPPKLGVSGLKQEFGLRDPGEFWVRLTGTVPDGEGTIAEFPFLNLQSEEAAPVLGSFVLYELNP